MRVTGPTTSGMSSLGSTKEGRTAKGASTGSTDVGVVSLSPEARALHEASLFGDDEVRPDMVAQARMMIEQGTLDTDENIDRALDHLVVHIF